jgi:replicative DNA helicase
MKKREKSSGNNSKRVKVEVPVNLFRNLITYLFSEHRNRPFLKKLNIFFKTINTDVFMQDPDLEPLYVIVKNYVQIVVEENMSNTELIWDRLVAIEKYSEEIQDILSDCLDTELDENHALYIENEFLDRLNFVQAGPIISMLKQEIQAFDKNDFDSFADIIERIREQTVSFTKSLSVKSSAIVSHPRISFRSEEFKTQLKHVHKNLTNPKRFIKTGLKRLNKMLGGGFQPGRVYVFMATSGGWKSGLLLNAMIWAAKYNKGIRCRDQSKKPLWLYITQENDTEETMDRIFSYIGSAKEGVIKQTPEEIFAALQAEGIIDDSCNIEVQYHPKGTITANDIENIVHDIESDGEYEVKLILHDYLKRLRPNISTGDLRIDLGEATNDLSTLAKSLKVPVVTANQLNRAAYDVMMQQGKNEHKNDLGKNASLTMQSESQMVTENADAVYAINKEYQKVTNRYFMTFTDLKNRAAKSNQTHNNRYFAQPFEDKNSMRLMEDEDTEEEYGIDSISDLLEKFQPGVDGEEESDAEGVPGEPALKVRNMPNGRKAKRVSINDAMEEME